MPIYQKTPECTDRIFDAIESVTGYSKADIIMKDRSEPLASVRAIYIVIAHNEIQSYPVVAKSVRRDRNLVPYILAKHKERISCTDLGNGKTRPIDKNYLDTYNKIKETLKS